MILKAIYFDSFKSLVNERLEINNRCTGIVGINESGKSNILEAIRLLNEDYQLEKSHVPKIKKSQGNRNPRIRYEFLLRKAQDTEIKKQIRSWLKTNSLIKDDLTEFSIHIEYTIEYDLEKEEEVRNFSVKAENPIGNSLILKREFFDTQHMFLHENKLFSLEEALLITNDIISSSEKVLQEKKLKRNSLKKELDQVMDEEQDLQQMNLNQEEFSKKKDTIDKRLADLDSQLKQIEEKWLNYDIEKIIVGKERELEYLIEEIKEIKNLTDSNEKIKNTLKSKSGQLYPHEKGQLTKAEKGYSSGLEKLEKKKKNLEEIESDIASLKVPLKEKYTDDIDELSFYMSKLLENDLSSYLPKVVFWEHTKDFILQSKTKFEEILKAKSLTEISRNKHPGGIKEKD